MTTLSVGRRLSTLVAALIGALWLLTGCSSSEDKPDITVAIGNTSTTVSPTLYCVNGAASLAGESAATAAVQVKPDQQVSIVVPDEVAEKSWAIQIWSVQDAGGSAVPGEQIGNVPVGTGTSYDGFTTSDAAPDRYFIIVVIPEDPGCNAKGSAGIWTLLVSRTA